jgi:hypothetical protein
MTLSSKNGNGNGHLISGLSLAHQKLSREERLQLAVDVKNRVRLYTPTDAEIAKSFRVSPASFSQEWRWQAEWAVENGIEPDRTAYAVARIAEGINLAPPAALDSVLSEPEAFEKVWAAIERLTSHVNSKAA